MDESQPYEINGGERIRIEKPEAAETGGICTCTGIGIINIRKKFGYLAHCNPLDKQAVENLVDEALSECEDPKHLKICLVGNMPSREDAKMYPQLLTYHQEHESWLIEMLLSKGIQQNKIDNRLMSTSPSDYFGYSIILETRLCAFKVLEEDNEGMVE